MTNRHFLSALLFLLVLRGSSLDAKDKDSGDGKADNGDLKQAAKMAKKEGKEDEKEAKAAAKEKKKDAIEEKKEAYLDKKKDSKKETMEAKKETKDDRLEARDKRVDTRAHEREANQNRRIEYGIAHGNLTPNEVSNLRARQSSVEQLRKTVTADGKMTTEEARNLRIQLNACSTDIFAEKHDTKGKAKRIGGFGNSIALSKEVADRLIGEEINRKDARAFLDDFHKMLTAKRRLSEETMSPEMRAKLQDEYNQLLNKYFVRTGK
jgi:hypothetical protein